MNTPTPAQALGEVMALSEKATAGMWISEYRNVVLASDPSEVIAGCYPSFDNANLIATAVNFIRQHGQHFAGLAERCREFEEIAALRKEAYELVHEACGEFKARAEAAEARCAEAEGLLRECTAVIHKAAELAGMDPTTEPTPESLGGRVAAFLAARG